MCIRDRITTGLLDCARSLYVNSSTVKSPLPKSKSAWSAILNEPPLDEPSPSKLTEPLVGLVSSELYETPDGLSNWTLGFVDAGIKLEVYFASPLYIRISWIYPLQKSVALLTDPI